MAEQQWYCPNCDCAVDPECVTYVMTHDGRCGGCNNDVEPFTPFVLAMQERIAALEEAPDLERTKRAMQIYKADLIIKWSEAWEKSKEQGE